MAETATVIILTAGTMTFGNEWYQTGKVNWKVPIATLLGAAIFDGLSHINERAAIGLSVIVLIGAATTQFGGKSVVDTLAGVFTQATAKQSSKIQPPKIKAA